MSPQTARIEAAAIADGSARTCPCCAETIKPEAIVCKHCGRDVPAAPPVEAKPKAAADSF